MPDKKLAAEHGSPSLKISMGSHSWDAWYQAFPILPCSSTFRHITKTQNEVPHFQDMPFLNGVSGNSYKPPWVCHCWIQLMTHSCQVHLVPLPHLHPSQSGYPSLELTQPSQHSTEHHWLPVLSPCCHGPGKSPQPLIVADWMSPHLLPEWPSWGPPVQHSKVGKWGKCLYCHLLNCKDVVRLSTTLLQLSRKVAQPCWSCTIGNFSIVLAFPKFPEEAGDSVCHEVISIMSEQLLLGECRTLCGECEWGIT